MYHLLCGGAAGARDLRLVEPLGELPLGKFAPGEVPNILG